MVDNFRIICKFGLLMAFRNKSMIRQNRIKAELVAEVLKDYMYTFNVYIWRLYNFIAIIKKNVK